MTEVAPGLFAISQWVALDGNISWVPRSARGWEPSTVYLVDGGEEALLYDTGLPVHRSAILEQLAERVGDRELALWTSRLVEPDSVGNVVPVLERLKVRRIMNATQSNQLRLVTHRWHEFTSENGYSVERLQWGERFRVGTRELEVIQPAARVIATSWLYDLESRVLLSSDFFGHLHRSEVATSPVFEGAAQASSVEQVREHLLAKYEWLRGADVAAICQSLEAIFADRETASGGRRRRRGVERFDAAHPVEGGDLADLVRGELEHSHPVAGDARHGADRLKLLDVESLGLEVHVHQHRICVGTITELVLQRRGDPALRRHLAVEIRAPDDGHRRQRGDQEPDQDPDQSELTIFQRWIVRRSSGFNSS